MWRAARFTSSYADPLTSSESEEENFEDGLDFNQGEEEDIAGIRRRLSNEASISRVGEALNQTLEPDRDESAAPRDHFSPVQVRFPVNAPALRPPLAAAEAPVEVVQGQVAEVPEREVNEGNMAGEVDYDAENGEDGDFNRILEVSVCWIL